MKPICFTVLLLLFCVPPADAQQTKVDRLERQLARTKPEALRLKRMLELSAAWMLIDPGMSLSHGRHAINLAERRQDSISLGRACHLTATALMLHGELPASWELMTRAGVIAERCDDSVTLYEVYRRLAGICNVQGRFKEAVEYSERFEALSSVETDSAKLCHEQLFKASIMHPAARKSFEHRTALVTRGMRIAERKGNTLMVADLLGCAAQIQLERGEFQAAFDNYERALYMYEGLGF